MARRPNQVARNVTDIIGAGAVGINLEDGPTRSSRCGPSRMPPRASARRAPRPDAAGVPIVINARIDLYYLKHVGDEATRFAETVRAGGSVSLGGRDCIFVLRCRYET